MMYLDHFGLQQAPFRITPHTEFFFAGANRGATLEALMLRDHPRRGDRQGQR
jgi:MSHA biogenesis protein MshM